MRALQRLWRGSSPLSQRWNAAIAASTRPSTLATALRGLGGTRGIAQCPSIKAVKSAGSGGKATVRGWIRTFRAQKAWNFIEINDGSTFNSLQVVVPSELKSAGLGTGAAVEIEGELVPHPKHEGEVELHATSVKVIGECDSDYPLQKKVRPMSTTMTARPNHLTPQSSATHPGILKRHFPLKRSFKYHWSRVTHA